MEIYMKAAVLTQLNSPLSIENVDLTELQFGQVLVKVLSSGICGSQLLEIKGHKGNQNFIPHLLGHEGFGLVVEIGQGVTTVSPGDHVILHWRKGEGIESDFPKYILNDRIIRSGKVTTFNEYSIVSENRITKVKDEVSSEIGSLLGCGLSTSFGVIINDVKLKESDRVLIVGSGGIGLCLFASISIIGKGKNNVLMTDSMKNKRSIVESFGCEFIDLSLISRNKFDIILDTVGNSKLFSQLIPLLMSGGKYIIIGHFDPNDDLIIHNANSLFEGEGKTIIATQGGKTIPHLDIPKYLDMINHSDFNVKNIFTHRFTLKDINVAINEMKLGNTGRILLEMI